MEKHNYACLALFVVQFFTLMLYLEIIELNFLGLNYNTRRNILIREEYENLSDDNERNDSFRRDSDIIITPDYIFNYDNSNNESKDNKDSKDSKDILNQETETDIINSI